MRAARKWFPILLLSLSCACFLVQLRWYYRAVEVQDVCTVCGIRSDGHEIWLFERRVGTWRHDPVPSPLSELLAVSTTDHRHSWRSVWRNHKDWWGPFVRPAAEENEILAPLFDSACTLDNLQRLSSTLEQLDPGWLSPYMPGANDLRLLVHRDILQETDPAKARRHASLLRDMCGTRDEKVLRRRLFDWFAAREFSPPMTVAEMEEFRLPILLSCLTDTRPGTREAAARSFGYLGDRSVLPQLEAATRDSDPHVREAAEAAIVRLDPRRRNVLTQRSVEIIASLAGMILAIGLWIALTLRQRRRRRKLARLPSMVISR